MNAHEQIFKLEQRMIRDMASQRQLVQTLLCGLLAEGSVLAEATNPDVARTIASLARNLDTQFCNVHFPAPVGDLPQPGSDLAPPPKATGEFFSQSRSDQSDMIFANLILVEGLHFAPIWLQMALLSAMAQRDVFSVGQTPHVPEIFLVLATHDSEPKENSHPLSTERLDQFLLAAANPAFAPIERSSPERGQPTSAPAPLKRFSPETSGAVSQQVIFAARAEIREVALPPAIDTHLATLASATLRPTQYSVELARWLLPGEGLRALVALQRASRVHAWLCGRNAVTLDDVMAVAGDCLRHRLVPSPLAKVEGKSRDELVALLLSHFTAEVSHAT